MAERPWTIHLERSYPGKHPFTGLTDPKNKQIELFKSGDLTEDQMAGVLAHEIAHAKFETKRNTGMKSTILGEGRAYAYAYIKGWAGPADIEAIVGEIDEMWSTEGLKQGSRWLLRNKKITYQEYINFTRDVEEWERDNL